MIDHFALALGHGLMAIVMLRLLAHRGLDSDPLLDELAAETRSHRKAVSASGRNAARRALGKDDDQGNGPIRTDA